MRDVAKIIAEKGAFRVVYMHNEVSDSTPRYLKGLIAIFDLVEELQS